MPDYIVYGLRVRADLEIPGFPPPRPQDTVDVCVTFDPLEAARLSGARSSWRPHPTLRHRAASDAPVHVEINEGDDVALEWSDGARFVISADASSVHVVRPPEMSHESICTYLVNSVLALCLRRRGVTCLHASAVEIGGQAVAFVGPSGAGKSTLAWAFGERGHEVMTDDVAAVAGNPPRLRPGYPRLRLWPWTVQGLLGDADALPRICEDWEKRSADILKFDVRDRPLGGLVLLAGFGGEVRVDRLPEGEAFAALMQNVSLAKILDVAGRRQDFVTLGAIAASVPMIALSRPRELAAVGASADAVVAWVRGKEH